MKWLDLPPVWLALFAALAWAQARWLPLWPATGAWGGPAGAVLVAAGLVLIALAAWQMHRHATTLIPHREADALVTTGVFARSRNPIYLGDALILTGLILRWDALPSLVLVPLFMALIARRFIGPEEARLARRFPEAFAAYAARVRRWL